MGTGFAWLQQGIRVLIQYAQHVTLFGIRILESQINKVHSLSALVLLEK